MYLFSRNMLAIRYLNDRQRDFPCNVIMDTYNLSLERHVSFPALYALTQLLPGLQLGLSNFQ